MFAAPPSLSFSGDVDSDHLLVSLSEGSDHRVDFTITSDPSLDTQSGHTLSKQGGSLDRDHVYIRGKTVCFSMVRRSDAGVYTVSTYNAVGKGQASFQLNIKCKQAEDRIQY